MDDRMKNRTNSYAFVGVNIIPMDSLRIMEDQTVLIRNGIIEKIGNKNEVKIPDSIKIIEGQNKYLMPG